MDLPSDIIEEILTDPKLDAFIIRLISTRYQFLAKEDFFSILSSKLYEMENNEECLVRFKEAVNIDTLVTMSDSKGCITDEISMNFNGKSYTLKTTSCFNHDGELSLYFSSVVTGRANAA